MIELTFKRPHDISKLHDELLAAVPSVQPKPDEAGRLYAVMAIESDGKTVRLEVPDDADQKAIAAVVRAHDPTPLPPRVSRKEKAREALRNLDETKPGPAIKAMKVALDELLADD